MRDRQTCVGCGKKSPETETNYTLISAQFGWRLTRYKSPEGELVVEWRCPTCWRDYKRARAATVEPLGRAPTPPIAFEPFRPRTTQPAPSAPPEQRLRTPVLPRPAPTPSAAQPPAPRRSSPSIPPPSSPPGRPGGRSSR